MQLADLVGPVKLLYTARFEEGLTWRLSGFICYC